MEKIKTFKEQVEQLRKELPNDKDFGMAVGQLLIAKQVVYLNEHLPLNDEIIDCCLCGDKIQENPITKWKYGHNPSPLSEKEDDRCCDDCNATEVIPARLRLIFKD